MKTYPIRSLLTLALLFTISPVEASTFLTFSPIGQSPTSIKKLPNGKSSIGLQIGMLPHIEGLWEDADQFGINIEHGITRNHKISISGNIRGGQSSRANDLDPLRKIQVPNERQAPRVQSIRASITQIITNRKNRRSFLYTGALQRSTTSEIDRGEIALTDEQGQTYGTAPVRENYQMYSGSGTIGMTFPLDKATLFATASIYRSYIIEKTTITSKQYNSSFQNTVPSTELEVQAGAEIELGLIPNSSVMLTVTISNEGRGILLNYNIILN